mmetsp:Transcript_17392/g.19479  ORF Transcript_17392/g.19479 Transcript_17392/m.19479 type:complete len:198 (+) Transcript_17392:47-640(+)
MIFLLRATIFYSFMAMPFLSMITYSFQMQNHKYQPIPSSSYAKKYQIEKKRSRTEMFNKDRNIIRSVVAYLLPDKQDVSNNSNNDQKTKSKNYNDDAFGFVFLGGFILTEDPVFAGIFILFSTLATIGTQNGILPAKNAVPAAVAGLTLIVSLLTPIPKEPSQLPNIDTSLIEIGICTVSMLYGFILSSDREENETQ